MVITRAWLALGRALLTVSLLVVVAPALSVIASSAPEQCATCLAALLAIILGWTPRATAP